MKPTENSGKQSKFFRLQHHDTRRVAATLGNDAVCVLDAIASHADDASRSCFPSLAAIARESNCAIKVLPNVIRQIEALGIFEREKRFKRSTSYTFARSDGAPGYTITSFRRREKLATLGKARGLYLSLCAIANGRHHFTMRVRDLVPIVGLSRAQYFRLIRPLLNFGGLIEIRRLSHASEFAILKNRIPDVSKRAIHRARDVSKRAIHRRPDVSKQHVEAYKNLKPEAYKNLKPEGNNSAKHEQRADKNMIGAPQENADAHPHIRILDESANHIHIPAAVCDGTGFFETRGRTGEFALRPCRGCIRCRPQPQPVAEILAPKPESRRSFDFFGSAKALLQPPVAPSPAVASFEPEPAVDESASHFGQPYIVRDGFLVKAGQPVSTKEFEEIWHVIRKSFGLDFGRELIKRINGFIRQGYVCMSNLEKFSERLSDYVSHYEYISHCGQSHAVQCGDNLCEKLTPTDVLDLVGKAFRDVRPDAEPAPPSPKPPAKTFSDNHKLIRDHVQMRYREHNSHEAPWNAATDKQLRLLLASAPSWTLYVWIRCIDNRFLSDKNLAEVPLKWIRCLSDYLSGPLDRFNNLKELSKQDRLLAENRRAKELWPLGNVKNGKDSYGRGEEQLEQVKRSIARGEAELRRRAGYSAQQASRTDTFCEYACDSRVALADR